MRLVSRALSGLGLRLVLSYVAVVVLALTLAGSLLIGVLNGFFVQQATDELNLRASLLADRIQADPYSARSWIAFVSSALQVHVVLTDADGQPVIDSGNLVSRDTASVPGPGQSVDTVAVRRTLPPPLYGYLELSQPLTRRAATLAEIQRDLIILGLATVMLAALVGLVLGRGLTAPLRRLTAATERLRAGDLGVVLPAGGGDEIADLSRGFNAMAQRLDESFATIAADRDRLRVFVADVSHELRTPITALRTFNELLLQGAGDDPPVRQEFLEESAAQIQRLDWLTQNLLDLSKLESGLLTMTLVPADLVETAHNASAANTLVAEAKDVTVTISADADPLVVPHDPQRLEQAISNVINNAVKFSPPRSTVHLRVLHHGNHACVAVSDQGSGISPSDLPHVFERFYRGKELTAGTTGSGLGLPIVKSIMDAHGGTVKVSSTPGHGTMVDLCLPAPLLPVGPVSQAE